MGNRREELRQFAGRVGRAVSELVGAGPVHRRSLDRIDTRIAVSGVRGKSTTVRWLYDVFYGRGLDTYAKVTGTEPLSIYNAVEHEIPRGEQVRLYENERELRKYEPEDVAVLENQGIREYTTRLVNEQFVKPDVVLITNVREDHLGTLGSDRVKIARALARAVPEGTQVVNGEQDPELRRYLAAELERRDAPVSHVTVPTRYRSIPGIECVYGVNVVLQVLNEPALTAAQIGSMRDQLRVSWRHLPEGRVFNAADVNDVQSTELLRQALLDDETAVVEPLVFLRADRRGRTASFRRYLDQLFETGRIRQVHAAGPGAPVLKKRLTAPAETYDIDDCDPGEALDAALAAGRPVLLMGNTVHEFMERMQAAIDASAVDEDRAALETPDRYRQFRPGRTSARRRRTRAHSVRR